MMGIPWVYSAILAFEGQVSVFNYQSSKKMHSHDDHHHHPQQHLSQQQQPPPPPRFPDYRDLLPTPPPPGDVPSCAEGGVLGVLPGTCGCLQATEVIKLILGRSVDELLVGRVLVMDAMRMKFSTIGLSCQPDRAPIAELIDYQGFCGAPTTVQISAVSSSSGGGGSSSSGNGDTQSNGRTMDEDDVDAYTGVLNGSSATATTATTTITTTTATKMFHTIAPQDALDKLLHGWTPFVLDVRLHTEHVIVALPFTDRVQPHRTVHVRDIPAQGDVLVYCKAGVRGQKACRALMEQGVDPARLFNLEGGILRWQKDVDASMPRY
jgi:sulfur-carrier protein adenylyltransferase/sulfurtransferase